MRACRSGMGLGDSLYLRPIVDYFVRKKERTVAFSNYPDVFLGSGAEVVKFSRSGATVVAHYVGGKSNPGTTQWDDVCISAGVRVPLRFDWAVQNPGLVDEIRARADGRPIVLVCGGRMPMDRKDGFGLELLPEAEAFEVALDELRGGCLLVQIGKAEQIYSLAVDVDLNGKTSVSDVLDLAYSADAVVAQCSFAVPLAEVFAKPLLAVWASKGLVSREPFIRNTTPKKVLSAPETDRFVFDDWAPDAIAAEARAFRGMFEAAYV